MACIVIIDELPTLDELEVFKYTDKGVRKKVRIIDDAWHKWKKITRLVCNDANVLSVLEQRYHRDPEECLRQVLVDYFFSRKPRRYSQDWNGLIELLEDAKLESLAEELRLALSLRTNKVQ
jgi:Fe-S cluster biosynthesis and repair protein YggX